MIATKNNGCTVSTCIILLSSGITTVDDDFSQGLKRFLFDSNRAVSGADLQATVEAAERRRVSFQQAPVDLALLWRWSQVIKACRKGIQIQFNLETVSKVRYIKHVKLFIHVYPPFSVWINTESGMALYVLQIGAKWFVYDLYPLYLVLDAFLLGRPIRRFYLYLLLMFMTWRCAFSFSTTHLILAAWLMYWIIECI